MTTEAALIEALTTGLMGSATPCRITSATGHYQPGDRKIVLDYGTWDVGPMIGAHGATKLAIQTLLACPFGGDNCHLQIYTTREQRSTDRGHPSRAKDRIANVMSALRDHLGHSRLNYRIESSATATVVLIETTALIADNIRGALSKLIRAIGRRHDATAVVSVETFAQPVYG